MWSTAALAAEAAEEAAVSERYNDRCGAVNCVFYEVGQVDQVLALGRDCVA